jgi:ABC-2 type transport system ATP-binding protein
VNENHVVIAAENLSRRFGDLVAVEGLNLAIQQREIFGLVGPDGAGKTTTLRMLASIMTPTDGRASIAGHDTVREGEAVKRCIGYMPQQFSLYGDLSVAENLGFFADVFGVRGPERRARMDRLLRFARLTEFAGRRAARLSGGMKKKLALACALIHQPEILLLDEPTIGVDPVSRREFWDVLAELHIQGVTILLSTPYMDEAERCSRIGLMYAGRMVMCDTPDRVRRAIPGDVVELRSLGGGINPSDLARAEGILAALPGVAEVQVYGDRLHIFVDDAAGRTPEIEAALAAAAIGPHELRPARARMEEAFISLIRRQGTFHRSRAQTLEGSNVETSDR